MVLQLDPKVPVVYRSPTSMQFGVSRPIVVLRDVTAATEHMIGALSAGVSRTGLAMIARTTGATDLAAEELLRALAPVLLRETEPTELPASVIVCGVGRTAARVAALLASRGVRVDIAAGAAEAESSGAIDLAVIIGHFVVEPELHGLWLRRDVPHLPVVLGDTEIAIGPFVEPGSSACLYCLNLHASDKDPAWPAVACQLWGRHSPADTELQASEIAAIVTRLVLARCAGEAGAATAQLVLQCRSGAISQRNFDPHPECGCLEAGLANARALTENGSLFAALPRG